MPIQRDDGFALLVAIMATLLMAAIGSALVLTTSSETRIADNFRRVQEGLYAAEAIVELATVALLAAPDWSALLSESSPVGNGPGDWRTLYSYRPLSGMLPPSALGSDFFVSAMIAGDSGSGGLSIRGESFGPRGEHSVVEVTVTQAEGAVRMVSWRLLPH
jgi:hypothetical protein